MRGAAPPKPTDLLTSIRVSGHIKLAKPKAQEDGYISKRKQILSGKFWFIKGKDSRGGCSLKSRQEASIKVFSIGTELVKTEESCKSNLLQKGGRLCEDKVGMISGDWNLPWSCHSPRNSFTFISFTDTPCSPVDFYHNVLICALLI